MESGGLLNPSLRDKKGHARVHKDLKVWVEHALPHQKSQFCSIPGHYILLCHGRVSDGM